MDPISQGALGASLPQSLSDKSHVRTACLLGFISGMAPDLDVLIFSRTDPLLFLEFHRQFTHSLIFIPIGGLLCALLLHFLFAKRRGCSFGLSYLFCTLGYATHGLLDTCTSYGTQLLWPFSNTRFAWDTLSIVDPLVTLPLLIFIFLAATRHAPRYALYGLLWVFCYQCFGYIQHQRVETIGYAIAQQRQHEVIRLEAKPTFGNLLLWKVIYETEDMFYSDGVRAAVRLSVFPGTGTIKLKVERDFPWLDENSQQAKDLQRFHWFSQGFLALDAMQANRVIDARYSLLPNETLGMWGITLDPDAKNDAHVLYLSQRDLSEDKRETFFSMLREHGEPAENWLEKTTIR